MDVTALVGTLTGVVGALGAPIAYLQLRDARRASASAKPTGSTLTGPRLIEWSVFAPTARVLGHGRELIDRTEESRRLVAAVRRRSPVAVIEGVGGVGKTALAATACRRLGRSRRVTWVFCEEKADVLSLRSLATGLSSENGLRDSAELAAATAAGTAAGVLADALVTFLAGNRLLPVLDDFHTVRDPGLRDWTARMVHTTGRSTVLLTSRRHPADIPHAPGAAWVRLRGLTGADTRAFLGRHGVHLAQDTLETVWQRAGDGNPQALTLFAGQCVETSAEVLAADLPSWGANQEAWIGPVCRALSPEEQKAARAVAFVSEAAPPELVAAMASGAAAHLTELESRFPTWLNVHRSAGVFRLLSVQPGLSVKGVAA